MRPSHFLVSALSIAFLASCGPITQDGGDSSDANSGDGEACVPTQTAETSCFDTLDNDCDGVADCGDRDCATICDGMGPDAGMCEEPVFPGDTLAIPDVLNVDYESTITISGFGPGQTLTDANDFLGLCVTMEHSWLRDLQLELDCPSGTTLILQAFRGRDGGEIFMGVPIDDDGTNPTPGVGYEYCWTPTATRGPSMTEWADTNLAGDTLPAGDYQTSDPYTDLQGCELNGSWTVRAVDDWDDDNGFIFGWTLSFNPDILPDCLVVVIE